MIVGRGGFVALRGRPATLHVSLRADLAFRVALLVDRGVMPDPDADPAGTDGHAHAFPVPLLDLRTAVEGLIDGDIDQVKRASIQPGSVQP